MFYFWQTNFFQQSRTGLIVVLVHVWCGCPTLVSCATVSIVKVSLVACLGACIAGDHVKCCKLIKSFNPINTFINIITVINSLLKQCTDWLYESAVYKVTL